MTNKILMSGAALLLAASLHAADNTSTHATTPFSGVTTNPCTGQPIQYFGSCHSTTKTQTGDSGSRMRLHYVCEAHGITPTGTIHRYLLNDKQDIEVDGCGFDSYTRDTAKVVSFGKEPNFFMEALVRMRVNDDCTPEVTVVEIEGECRGAGQ